MTDQITTFQNPAILYTKLIEKADNVRIHNDTLYQRTIEAVYKISPPPIDEIEPPLWTEEECFHRLTETIQDWSDAETLLSNLSKIQENFQRLKLINETLRNDTHYNYLTETLLPKFTQILLSKLDKETWESAFSTLIQEADKLCVVRWSQEIEQQIDNLTILLNDNGVSLKQKLSSIARRVLFSQWLEIEAPLKRTLSHYYDAENNAHLTLIIDIAKHVLGLIRNRNFDDPYVTPAIRQMLQTEVKPKVSLSLMLIRQISSSYELIEQLREEVLKDDRLKDLIFEFLKEHLEVPNDFSIKDAEEYNNKIFIPPLDDSCTEEDLCDYLRSGYLIKTCYREDLKPFTDESFLSLLMFFRQITQNWQAHLSQEPCTSDLRKNLAHNMFEAGLLQTFIYSAQNGLYPLVRALCKIALFEISHIKEALFAAVNGGQLEIVDFLCKTYRGKLADLCIADLLRSEQNTDIFRILCYNFKQEKEFKDFFLDLVRNSRLELIENICQTNTSYHTISEALDLAIERGNALIIEYFAKSFGILFLHEKLLTMVKKENWEANSYSRGVFCLILKIFKEQSYYPKPQIYPVFLEAAKNGNITAIRILCDNFLLDSDFLNKVRSEIDGTENDHNVIIDYLVSRYGIELDPQININRLIDNLKQKRTRRDPSFDISKKPAKRQRVTEFPVE